MTEVALCQQELQDMQSSSQNTTTNMLSFYRPDALPAT